MKGIYLEYTSPVKTGENLNITIRIANKYGYISNVKALFNRYGQKPGEEAIVLFVYNDRESDEQYSVFNGKIRLSQLGYHTFYITLGISGVEKSIKYSSKEKSPVFDNGQPNLEFWKCFSYLDSFKTPEWVKGEIMYQIFVDTYCCKDPPESIKDRIVSWNTFPKWRPDIDGIYRNDQYYGGNIRGIISKLPYIHSLGVTIIYLTPIFKGDSSNRYDIVDYESIDEMIGTWEDVTELKRKANALGIKVIQDVVFNHASSKNSLIKTNPGLFTGGNWWGYENLVEFNKNNPEYFKLLEKWLAKYSKYFDGFRFDVADEIPDNVLRFIRKTAKKYNVNVYLLGEVWKNAVTGDYRGFFYGDELDGVMNYQFTNAIYRFVRWKKFDYFMGILNDIKILYPSEALDVSPIFLSSHDIPRIPNILVGDFMKEDPKYENVWSMEDDGFWYTDGQFDTLKFRSWEVEHDIIPKERLLLAKKRKKAALFLQYTLPGLPAICAGDEMGVMGFKDPFNRKPMPWDNIDYDDLNLYIQLGQFRHSYRDVFADSRNFVPNKVIDMQGIWRYKRDNMDFELNTNNWECKAKVNGKTELYIA